jgi:hypothetical protein
LLHNYPHLSSGAGTIGQKLPQYKGLSPTPLGIIIIIIIIIINTSGIRKLIGRGIHRHMQSAWRSRK